MKKGKEKKIKTHLHLRAETRAHTHVHPSDRRYRPKTEERLGVAHTAVCDASNGCMQFGSQSDAPGTRPLGIDELGVCQLQAAAGRMLKELKRRGERETCR